MIDIIIIDDFDRDPTELCAELCKLHEEIQDAFSFWHGAEISTRNVQEFHEATKRTLDLVERAGFVLWLLRQSLRKSHEDIHKFIAGAN